MKRIIIATLIMLLTLGIKAQIITETISDPFIISISYEDLFKQEMDRWQQELEKMHFDRSISDNIKVNVSYKLNKDNDKIDMAVEFSYMTIDPTKVSKYANGTADDYPLGVYDLFKSNAAVLLCDFMKEKIDGELAEYMKPETKITINITGTADGTRISKTIPYNGEYGDMISENVVVNGEPSDITVSQNSGITTNAQLAFMRACGIRYFVTNYIDSFKITDNEYNMFAVENKEKGDKFRCVIIEVIIHDAMDVMPKAKFNQN